MQQMKTQGAKARRLMAFILFTFFAAGPVFGQTGPSERVQIPFEFTFGSKVLPAGTYAFSVDNFGLKMESATGEGFHARIISRLGGPTEFLRDGSLVFDKTGGVRILSEVWILGTDGILLHSTPSNHTHEILPFFTPLGPNVSGRVAYDRTCARCHGRAGAGDEKADKFFKTTIPRLSSAEVQGKSDAELREIIAKGTRLMPPVEIEGSAGFLHRLPLQDVDAVIAYVRTLKR